jgi:8-oxo-dGTP pyrophosphatase MutT (NUDIX family)
MYKIKQPLTSLEERGESRPTARREVQEERGETPAFVQPSTSYHTYVTHQRLKAM